MKKRKKKHFPLDSAPILYYNIQASCRCNSMAECPLPKPNTRVRFPSSAPKKKRASKRLSSFFVYYTNRNPAKRNAFCHNVRQSQQWLSRAFHRTFGFRFPSSAPKTNAEWKHSAFVFYPSHGLGISLTHAVRRISSRAACRPCISSRAGVHLPCGLMG